MGLASQTFASSVTELSLSPCYHYQFSSISQAIGALCDPAKAGSGGADQVQLLTEKMLAIKKAHFPKPLETFWLLNTDSSPLLRPHSGSLPDRRYVYQPTNQVKGNKPVAVGYEFSTVGLSGRERAYGLSGAPWNLPLSMRLIPFEENRNRFTAGQVNELLDNEQLPFHTELTLNALDSNYSTPEYIALTHHQPHLVNLIRLASNRNVWKQLSQVQQQRRRQSNADKRGANAIYGHKYTLSEVSDWDLPPDQEQEFGIKLANGKQAIVKMMIWEDMLLRSKRGLSMKDKAFRLASVELFDAQGGLPLFKKRLWLSLWGERRAEISHEAIFWAYRNRFDIEHFFRFGKQRLLLDQFQTPDEQHWQNWLEVVNLAYWLLWVARQEASHHSTKKWQQYDPTRKKRKELGFDPAPSQVQQQLESIILSFEKEPFLPKVQIKGKGRIPGTQFPKRTQYPVRKKSTKKKKAPV